jgi:hypothetical protein
MFQTLRKNKKSKNVGPPPHEPDEIWLMCMRISTLPVSVMLHQRQGLPELRLWAGNVLDHDL